MLANGLRPRSGEGAHRIVLDYAHAELGDTVSDDDSKRRGRFAKTAPSPNTATSPHAGSTATTSAPRPTSPSG